MLNTALLHLIFIYLILKKWFLNNFAFGNNAKHSSQMYTIRSKSGKDFKVEQNVINASTLLKNICEFTSVTEPLEIGCSSYHLAKFISLINNFDNKNAMREWFREFKDMEKLMEMILDLGILDSDILLDSVADFILRKVGNMKWRELRDYFELEDEFTDSERKQIDENNLEFFISVDFKGMKFPFPETKFSILPNRFYTPLNALLARIIQKSNCEVAFQFSLINKTLKNENDRHPIKTVSFDGGKCWVLEMGGFSDFRLWPKERSEKYFDKIKFRKVIVVSRSAELVLESTSMKDIKRFASYDFIIIPDKKKSKLEFRMDNISVEQLYLFDLEKCPFSFINFKIANVAFGFEKFYKNFIAKTFSKKLKIFVESFFDIFPEADGGLRKNPDTGKFCEVSIDTWNCTKPRPKFKKFIMNYMEEDGFVLGNYRLFPQVEEYARRENESFKFVYTVSQALEGFKIMESRLKFPSNFQEFPQGRPLSPVQFD